MGTQWCLRMRTWTPRFVHSRTHALTRAVVVLLQGHNVCRCATRSLVNDSTEKSICRFRETPPYAATIDSTYRWSHERNLWWHPDGIAQSSRRKAIERNNHFKMYFLDPTTRKTRCVDNPTGKCDWWYHTSTAAWKQQNVMFWKIAIFRASTN